MTTASIANGDLLVVTVAAVNLLNVTSISAGGNIIDTGLRSGLGNRRSITAYYVPSATAVASGSTITVNFSTASGGAEVQISRVTVVGGVAPTLDSLQDDTYNSTAISSRSGRPLNLTCSSCFVVQATTAMAGSSAATVTGATGSGWTHTNVSTYAGFTDQAGITSFTPPTWSYSLSPTVINTAAIAFGFTPTPCTQDFFIDFSAGTVGNTPSFADAESSIWGAHGNQTPIVSSGASTLHYFTFSGTNPALLTYADAAAEGLTIPRLSSRPRLCHGGSTFSDTSNKLMKYTSSGTAQSAGFNFFPPTWGGVGLLSGTDMTMTLSYWVYTDVPLSEAINEDISSLFFQSGSGPSKFSNAYLFTGPTFKNEGPAGVISGCTWSGGIATCNTDSPQLISSGYTYNIIGILPVGWNCNACVVTVSGSTISFPLAANPGPQSLNGTIEAKFSVNRLQWYRFTNRIQYGGNNQVLVRDTSGNVVGYILSTPAQSASYPYQGNIGATAQPNTAGRHVYWTTLRVCVSYTSGCPLADPM